MTHEIVTTRARGPMDPITVVIPGRPPLLNWERSAHWRTHRDITRSYRDQAKIVLLSKRKEWQRLDHVKVDVYQVCSTRKLPDTAANVPAAKAIIDGAVDAGLIHDDTPDVVRHTAFWAPVHLPGFDDQILVAFTAIEEGSPWMTPTWLLDG